MIHMVSPCFLGVSSWVWSLFREIIGLRPCHRHHEWGLVLRSAITQPAVGRDAVAYKTHAHHTASMERRRTLWNDYVWIEWWETTNMSEVSCLAAAGVVLAAPRRVRRNGRSVYIYIYIYIHDIHIHTHTSLSLSIYIYIYIKYIYVSHSYYIHIHILLCVCIYIYVYVCIYIYISTLYIVYIIIVWVL